MDPNLSVLIDITAKVASIITGIVAVYFLIKDREQSFKITLSYEIREFEIKQNEYGGFIKENCPAIVATMINNGGVDINIASMDLLVNGDKNDAYPGGFFEKFQSQYWYRKIEPIPRFRRIKPYFYGQGILDKMKEPHKNLTIQVIVFDESGKKFKSNKLRLHSKSLANPNQE